MMPDTLPADKVAIICTHMNDDHADAVAGYVRHFAGRLDVRAARLTNVDVEGMDIAVDGEAQPSVRIAFDRPLRDADDARETLVAMARQTPP